MQLARQEYLVDKHVFGVRDTDLGALKRAKSPRVTSRGVSMMALDEEERQAIAAARERGMDEGGNWRTFAMGGGVNTNCALPMSESYSEMAVADNGTLSAGTTRPGPAVIAAARGTAVARDARDDDPSGAGGGSGAVAVPVSIPVADASAGAVGYQSYAPPHSASASASAVPPAYMHPATVVPAAGAGAGAGGGEPHAHPTGGIGTAV